MTRIAKISCPHCGKPITVRDADTILDSKIAEEFWNQVDELFREVDRRFKKLMASSIWKRK